MDTKKTKKLNAPKDWSEVTLNQAIRMNELVTAITDDNVEEAVDELVKMFNSKDYLMAINFDFKEVIQCYRRIIEVMSHSIVPKDVSSYIVDGETYHIAKPEDIDFQSYIDITYINGEGDVIERMKKASLVISILTENRPEEPKAWADKVADNVSVEDALGMVLFFSSELQRYMLAIRQSSHQEEIPERKTKKTE